MIVAELLLWVIVFALATLLVCCWYVVYQIYKEDRRGN
jgi:hypothetical protein